MKVVAKKFRYLTEPLKIEPAHLRATPLLSSMIFHLMNTPQELIGQVPRLLSLRESIAITERPVIIWEPAPPSCIPANLVACMQAARMVDIFSPNHIELAALFDVELTLPIDSAIIEELAQNFLRSGIGPNGEGTIVIRAGDLGCCVFSRKIKRLVWLPPYYQQQHPELSNTAGSHGVVDPTGAGNTFLGGFAIGLLETKDDIKATCYGTVATSFALEQIGLPDMLNIGDGRELWNNVSVRSRLTEYLLRASN